MCTVIQNLALEEDFRVIAAHWNPLREILSTPMSRAHLKPVRSSDAGVGEFLVLTV